MSDDVLWCRVCGDEYYESRIDLFQHVTDDHTLNERLDSLIEKGARPEDTHA